MNDIPHIFIAYARKDSTFLGELRVHLKPLERSRKVKVWYDGKIEPGEVWEASIKKHLHEADIILLLISADAINSDYFYEKEMADALQRHREGTATVVPFIIRPCAWQHTPLAELQALPKDGKAVTRWGDKDHAYSDAVISLGELVEKRNADKKAETERQERERKAKEEAKRREAAAAITAQKEAERQRQQQENQSRLDRERQRQKEAEEKRRQQKATEKAEKEKERLHQEREKAARQAELRRQKKATEAERRRQSEAEKQSQWEVAQQRRKGQKQKIVAGIRSPWAWGSVLGALLFFVIFKMCDSGVEQQPTSDATEELATPSEAALAYIVDTDASVIKWEGYKPGKYGHNGTMKLQSGLISINGGIIESGSFIIDIASMECTDLTEHPDKKMKLEGHLKSGDFFEVEKFPLGSFVITDITPIKGNQVANFTVIGNLVLKGISKSIKIPAKIRIGDEIVSVITPEFTINRTEWGVNHGSGIIGTFKDQLIADEVKLQISLKAAIDRSSGFSGDEADEDLKENNSNPSSFNNAPSGKYSGKYLVIAGTFKVKNSAEIQLKELKNLGYENASTHSFDIGKYTVVLVDRFDDKAKARRLVNDLKAEGVSSYVKSN